MSKDITFEEYLGTYSGPEPEIDCGTSEIYTKEELESAVVRIKCQFAFWDGCELHSIRYAGDGAVSEERLGQLKQKDPDADYTQVAEFLMDFRTGENKGNTTFVPDREYTDYQWYLTKNEEGGWDIIDFGYGG